MLYREGVPVVNGRRFHRDDHFGGRLGLVAPVLVHAQRVASVAHVVALVAVVLDLEVLSLNVVDDVVPVLAGVAALEARVLARRVVALHPQRDYLAQLSLVGVVEHQTRTLKKQQKSQKVL